MPRITLTGATGMIGRALVRELREGANEVTALSRDAERGRKSLAGATGDGGAGLEVAEWRDPKTQPPPLDALRGRDAVVHLLGETVAQRWTDAAKREIRDSRVLSTRRLVAAVGQLAAGERPRRLICQSAAGWYGSRGNERLDEDEPAGSDFLATVVRDWEAEAAAAEELGLDVVTTRTGVVLSQQDGALGKMLPFFKLGIGGPVAGGAQYVPWVHLDDVVGAIATCIDGAASGPVNVTAPEPVTNRELSRTLGRVLRRPAFAPVPGLAVRTLYGEMASIVTTGQRAVPARLQSIGYPFRRPELEAALREATGRGTG